MLQLLGSVKCMRLSYKINPAVLNDKLRFLSDKCKKPGDKETKTAPACQKKPDCKKAAEPKKVPECKAKKPEGKEKDLTAIGGGAKCKEKKPKPCPETDKNKNKNKEKVQLSCQELILQREGISKNKNKKLTKVSGGAPVCPCPPCPTAKGKSKKNIWGKVTLMGLLPAIALLTLFVFGSHHEEERPEYIYYPHMYRRTKPFYFKDGNSTRFHNPHVNALPPDGYEDEIDVEANGKTPESDEERSQREKEFSSVQNDWKKMNDKRVAEQKKAEAAAEKEAQKAQAEAEKEEKKRLAEAEKEQKKQQAEAEKAEKKAKAEAEKEEKQRAKDAAKAQKVSNSVFNIFKSKKTQSDDTNINEVPRSGSTEE